MTSPPNRPGKAAPQRQRGVPAADSPEVVARVMDELGLVDVIARQLRRELGGKVMFDDLVSFGREGLLQAARTFDPTVGVAFRRWANYRVRGAMLDGVRTLSMLPRSVYERLRAIEGAHHASEGAAEDGTTHRPASAEEADARLGTYLAGIATAVAMGLLATPAVGELGEGVDPGPAADDQLARAQTVAAVREAVETLPEQERHLFRRHYFEDVRLDEAANELGLSKSWGSRLHSRAIESITRHMKRSRTTL
jgi:RNA polymerase sigma factor for flagellar operon FliA